MSLLDQQLYLYSQPLSRCEDGSFSKEFFLPVDFVGFQGHFPQMPVLPAVVQVMMARLVLRELQGEEEAEGELLLAKFLVPLGPDQSVCVEGREEKGKWQISFFVNETRASELHLRKEVSTSSH